MSAPRFAVLLLAAALAASPLAAQHRAAPLPTLAAPVLLAPAASPDASEGGDLPLLVASGLVAGAAGTFGGALAGLAIACVGKEGSESCYLNSWLWGAAIGESLAMPVGVHLANGRRGSLGLSLLASAGLGALGLALLEETHYDPTGAVLVSAGIPLAQLAATIAIERATAR